MSKWTGKKSPVNLPRGRRDSASINISHFHKGIPVWIENTLFNIDTKFINFILVIHIIGRQSNIC